MKRSVATIAMFMAMTSFSYGEDKVDVVNENDINYVSLNTITKNLDGEVFEQEGKIGFRFNNQEILISKDQSFFLSKGKYKPVNIQKVDGYNVPCDTKVLLKDEQVYVPINMLNDNSILKCYVEDDNFKIGEKEYLREPERPVLPKDPITTPPEITTPPVTPPVNPPEPSRPEPEPPKPEPQPPKPPKPEPEPPKPEPEPPTPEPEPPTPEPPTPEPEPPTPEPEPEQ